MENKMNAYGFYKPNKEEGIPLFEKKLIDKPVPKNRQILVEVKAVSVNPTDLATHSMKKSEDESFTVLGRDVAGVVVETGPEVCLFKKGDEVFYPGTTNVQGAQADFHVIDERMAALKPRNLSFSEAAALPLTALTSYEVMHDRLNLFRLYSEPEKVTLLIIGAAGGVGSIACQIALNYGFTVIGTASTTESSQYVKNLGVQTVINHKEPLKNQLTEKGIEKVDAEFGIGTNPSARITGIVLEDEKVYGTIHIAFGSNKPFGGTTEAGVHIDCVVKFPTVWLDGEKIIENGKVAE
jgi:NADPH:quinone reductase